MGNEVMRWDLEAVGAQPWVANTPTTDDVCVHNITMDVGSTSERTLVFEQDLSSMSEPLVVDSGYYQIDRPIESIRSASPNLSDNLEIVITPKDKSHMIGRSAHILKGTLRRSVNENFVPMSANASKIDQVQTYVNIFANLGITLLYQMRRMGHVYTHNNIKFTVSLPSEDLDNQTRINEFMLKLCGEYIIEFPRLKVSFDFSIREEDVVVASEIEATMYYYFSKHSRNTDDNIFFIEGGGRNISYSGIKEGIISRDAAFSLPGGGTLLSNLLAKQISQQLNVTRPRLEQMEQVLTTGQWKMGNTQMDALPCVNAAKEEFAATVYSGLLRSIDLAGLQANEISKIVCDGRIFKEIKAGGHVLSRSIMAILMEKFHDVSPSTEFEYTGVDYPVPEGLVAIRIEEEVQM